MYKNEKYEWMDFWWDNANMEGKRVLLIGDSISRDGYYHIVYSENHKLICHSIQLILSLNY